MASSMGSVSDQNLSCPICLDVFKDPVMLQCSHSFCAACWQQFITGKAVLECPVCKTPSYQRNPPRNLVLKNLCEDFLKVKTEQPSTGTEDLCSLHSEKLKLFCLDDLQPVCVICLHSNSHNNHCIRPIDEAAQDYKEGLQELLKPSQEKLELLNGIKANFDQTSQNIEGQAQDTERQIKDTFLMLQKFLQEEEQARIDAVRVEKNQKIQMMKSKSGTLSREIAALSDTVRDTEEVLRAENFSFLHNYKTAAEMVQHSLVDAPPLIPEGPIDVTKHLNNLSHNILDSIKMKLPPTRNPQTAVPDPSSVNSLHPFRSRPRLLPQSTQTSNCVLPLVHGIIIPRSRRRVPTSSFSHQPFPTGSSLHQPVSTILEPIPSYPPTPISNECDQR